MQTTKQIINNYIKEIEVIEIKIKRLENEVNQAIITHSYSNNLSILVNDKDTLKRLKNTLNDVKNLELERLKRDIGNTYHIDTVVKTIDEMYKHISNNIYQLKYKRLKKNE